MADVNDHNYSSENVSEDIPAKRRYARFLYEISIENDEVKKLQLFQDVPLQDFKKKNHWCNYICFGADQSYFYSRVVGSKGCPVEKE